MSSTRHIIGPEWNTGKAALLITKFGFIGQGDMLTELASKFIEQIRMHELVIIRDVKTNDSFAFEGFRKLSSQSIHVRLLHAKDGVGPTQMTFGDNDARVGLCANGADLIVRRTVEQFFSRQAAQSVSAANEEQFFGRGHCHDSALIPT